MQTTTMQCFNFNSVASEWSVCAGAAADSCGKSGEGAEDEEKPGEGGSMYILIVQRFFRYGQKLHRGALLQCKHFVILIQRLSVTILHFTAPGISVTIS